jgi:hypothetical protein
LYLAYRVWRFIGMANEARARRYVARHLELLDDDALRLLDSTIAEARARDDQRVLGRMEENGALLRRMRAERAGLVLPLDRDEIARRYAEGMVLADSDDLSDLIAALVPMEALAAEPGFEAASAEDQFPVVLAIGDLRVRCFTRTDDKAELSRARAALARAVALSNGRPVETYRAEMDLALSYHAEYERTGSRPALRQAVQMLQRITPPDAADRCLLDSSLGTTLVERHDVGVRNAAGVGLPKRGGTHAPQAVQGRAE